MNPNTLTQLLSDLLAEFQLERGRMSFQKFRNEWWIRVQDLSNGTCEDVPKLSVFTEGFIYRQTNLIVSKLKKLNFPHYGSFSLTNEINIQKLYSDDMFEIFTWGESLNSYEKLINLGRNFEDEG